MKNLFMSSLGLILLFTGNTFAFSDVESTHQNNQAIEYLKDKQIIQGYADGTFKPEKEINRAEMIKILVEGNEMQPTLDSFKNCFPDVQEEWFAPYVCYAKSQEWIGGYPDGTFKPSQTVSKAESIKMILNAFDLPLSEATTSPFSDVNEGDWFAPYIRTAKEKGLLEETSITFNPAMSQSRAKVSENLFRTMVIKEKKIDIFALNQANNTITSNEELNLATDKCPITDGQGELSNNKCIVVSCNEGYEARSNKCLVKTTSCNIENGSGVRTWDLLEKKFMECLLDYCDDGYIEKDGICIRDIEMKLLNNGMNYYLYPPCVANDNYKWCFDHSVDYCGDLGMHVATKNEVLAFTKERAFDFPCLNKRSGSCEKSIKNNDGIYTKIFPYAVSGITDEGIEVKGLSNLMCVE